MKKSNNVQYETGIDNFPTLYVTFLNENFYYLGFDANPKANRHAFVILRKLNLNAFAYAVNADNIIPEIDCFDNRIVDYETMIERITPEDVEKCFKDDFSSFKDKQGITCNQWFTRRKRQYDFDKDGNGYVITYNTELPIQLDK